ncbi:YqzL family protein [Paenibacillus filicis]|uniref:YqzL family protein n=1 Tax=Paenibacillus filicis TaxID=669464 RepID=A0ABU9DLE6_9BACL
MKDFSWKYFSMTGDVDAYLLYKESNGDDAETAEPEESRGFAEETDWIQ